MTIDSQGVTLLRDRGDQPTTTPDGVTPRYDTPCSRAMRASLARAFPVRTSSLREALVNGSITKLARP